MSEKYKKSEKKISESFVVQALHLAKLAAHLVLLYSKFC